ncbi:MAG: ATP-binding protein [Egibacteraceae bacterium]
MASQSEEIWRVLGEQNPWRSAGTVPATLAPPFQRPLVDALRARLLHDVPRRFQVVLGHRRVGKTTVMYQLVARLLAEGWPLDRLWWYRLDHPFFVRSSLGDLVRPTAERASSDAPALLLLDEIVYAEGWDLWLKTFYDERWPVHIIATSSATAILRDRRMESGVGRWEEQYLAPMLLDEYVDLRGEEVVDFAVHDELGATLEALPDGIQAPGWLERRRTELLLAGGFPELLAALDADSENEEITLVSQRTLRADAVERALYKDIPQSFNIEDPLNLERVLYTLAGQVAQVLSPQAIARDLGLSAPTINRYIGYLERAFLVYTLPNFAPSEGRVQRRGRKLYFVDPAVRNAALQRGIAPLADPAELGHLVENLAASHLLALAQNEGHRLFHWRRGNHEIDLVYDAPRPLAFEVSTSASHSRRGLLAFRQHHHRFGLGCYLVAPNLSVVAPQPSNDHVGTLPLDLFLLLVGRQASRALARRLGGRARS